MSETSAPFEITETPGARRRALADCGLILLAGIAACFLFLGQNADWAPREARHGVIAAEMAQSGDYFVMGEGTLYPHLHQMEQDGLVEGCWETAAGGRERRRYRITEKGMKELARKREEWRKFQEKVNRVLNLAPEAFGA